MTLIVQTILTWLIGGIVAYRDLWRRTVAPLAPPLRPLFLQRAAARDVVLVHPIALQKRSVTDPRRRPEQNATLLRLAAPPVRDGRIGPLARLLAWFLATPDVAHVHVTAVEPVGGPRARVHVSAHAQPSGSAAAGSGGSTGFLGPPVDLSVHLPAPAEAAIAQAANNAAAAGYERSEARAAGASSTAGQTMPGVAAGSQPAALRARHRGEGATADEREPLSPPSAGMNQPQAGGTVGGGQAAQRSSAGAGGVTRMTSAPPPLHIHPERYTHAVPITKGKPRVKAVIKGLGGLALRGLLVAVILFPFIWGVAIAITAGIWGK